MDLIEIDKIHAQAAQRIVAAFDDVLAAEPFLIGTAPHSSAHLGGDHDFIARGHFPQILARDLFAQARRVNVGGVEEIDPRIERDFEMLARILLVHVPAARADGPIGHIAAAIAHASQTNAGHRNSGLS